MKIRNKKTGKIFELTKDKFFNYDIHLSNFNSLAELNENWEDVEEPKKYCYITSCGEIIHRGYRLWENESVYDKKRQEMSNYFETEEEAEKAVEKLKAWKRLKDKGFKFEWWITDHSGAHIEFYLDSFEWDKEATKDLNLLFGGEDE